MPTPVLLRKARSALTIAASAVVGAARNASIRIFAPGVTLGRGVRLGRNVSFRVYGTGTVTLGDRTIVQDAVCFYATGRIEIGPDTFVGRGTEVVALSRITIGANGLLAAGCVVRDADHRFDDPTIPIRQQGHDVSAIEIDADVWLGAHVVVVKGARIGRGCVVGANAVVRGELPERAIAVGVPARVVGYRGERGERGERGVAPQTALESGD